MPQVLEAEVHLRRAYELLQEVNEQTETFRKRAAAYSSAGDNNSSFLGSMADIAKQSMQLKKEKASLISDLQLADQELNLATQIDTDASIEPKDQVFGIPNLKAMLFYLSGTTEMIWGKARDAEPLLKRSLEFVDFADAHYMLGILYEDDHKPADALFHFEKCLELDPNGNLSIPALREANAMRNYRKKFRGNWLIVALLALFVPFPPFLWGVVYFMMKRK